jgi:hypothetical protein
VTCARDISRYSWSRGRPAVLVNGRVEKSMSKWSTEMPMKSLAAAVAVAVSIAGLTAPAAQAKGKHFHHRHFFFKPYFHAYEPPACGRWVWSTRYHRYRCAWWY